MAATIVVIIVVLIVSLWLGLVDGVISFSSHASWVCSDDGHGSDG